MPSSLLEIVDLGDGEIVLQRADDDSEPLLTIQFSDETRIYLMDNGLEVAKAMIQAGIQAAAEIVDTQELQEHGMDADADLDFDPEAPRVLH
ncbi:MAG: hypothetical protein AB8C02_18220 [Halioglobus sp.]